MADRQTILSISLGGEQISLRRIESLESLGNPFLLTVDLVAALGEIDLLPHLGKPANILVFQDGETLRYFHGIVVEGEYLSEQADGYHYRLGLRPWTYLLDQNRNYAIYQGKSVIDIAHEVFDRSGIAKVDYSKLGISRAKRVYCVQYGESDFDFISRLFEEEGIYYYFDHSQDGHVMVLCEAPESHSAGTPSALTYNPYSDSVINTASALRSSAGKQDFMHSWHERVSTAGQTKVTLRDFNFERAEKPLQIVSESQAQHANDASEVYEYPGRYSKEAQGKPLGDTLLAALRANRQLYTGETQAAGLSCGRTFSLASHPYARFNHRYLITRTHHITSVETERSGTGSAGTMVAIEAVRAEVHWRSLPTTVKPVVKGPETAIVTGPEGEEIYTDEYGRVKVRFHWDRARTSGDKSTCWIRVSQTGGLGNIILPRVGHEVVVDFLNGDPDRPIVVGRVFNSRNMPIYKLPANKTRALWRTKRYGETGSYGAAVDLDTGKPGANELRFEDKGGQEEVFLHAERDMNVRVRHKETHHVGLDQEFRIGQDRTEYVKRNEKVTIDGARQVAIKETDKLVVKKSISIKAGTTIDMEAGTRITLKVGSSTITIEPTGIKIHGNVTTEIDAGVKVTNKVGGNFVTMNPGMVAVKGTVVLINSGGAA